MNKYDIADVFFMDVNFDGKEEFVCTLLGNGKLLYECYDIGNVVVEGKEPQLVKPLEEEPYNRFASGAVPTIEDCTVFDHQKKEIFIYTISGCCAYYNTWAKMVEVGHHGNKPRVKVVKEERHSFQKEGDGGIETIETFMLSNDSLKMVERKEVSF